MNIKQLRYFLKIAELGNMTRAAEALYIAQPALSQQLANLEGELGVRLLDRGVHGAKLTPPGGYVYAQAKSIIRQIDHVKSVLARESSFPSGRATIGMPASIARLLGEALVRHFIAAEKVLLEVAEHPSADLVDLVAIGKLDVAIVTDAIPRKGVLITPLFVESLFAVVPEHLAGGRSSISLKELSALPLLISGTHTVAQRIAEAFHREHLPYRIVAEISGTDTLVRMIVAGLGCSILPFSAVGHELMGARSISVLSIQDCRLDRTVSLCEPEGKPLCPGSTLVKEKVIDLMRAACATQRWLGCRPASP